MKIAAVILASVVLMTTAWAGDTTSMQMAYLLNEASGSRTDQSTNALTLTDNNTVTSTTGQFGDAALFTSANSEWLSRTDPDQVELNATNYTIAFWAKQTTTSATELYHLYKGGGFSSGWAIVISDAGGGTIGLYHDTAVAATFVNANVDDTGAFHHFCIRFDDAANTVNWRFDNADSETDSGVTSNPTATATDFNMGRAGANGRYINAAMDDATIFTRLLTAAECTDLYNNGLASFVSPAAGAPVVEAQRAGGIGLSGVYQLLCILTVITLDGPRQAMLNTHRLKFDLDRPWWMRLQARVMGWPHTQAQAWAWQRTAGRRLRQQGMAHRAIAVAA